MPFIHSVRLQAIFRWFVALVAIILIIGVFKNVIPRDFYHPLLTYIHCKVNGTVDDNQDSKRILLYTTWFGRVPWSDEQQLLQCPHKCLITYNKCELPYSDAVVFHANSLKLGGLGLRRVGEYLRRSPHQRWVYYTHESPQNIDHDPAQFNGFFNWTITYKSDSDIVYPYGHYSAIESKEKTTYKTNYAKGKDKLIAWAVSHCGTVRDKVVEKLLKFLPVTVIGRCSHLFNQVSPEVCKQRSSKCSFYLKRFKFYLAFENGLCIDYITEKYWSNPHNHNMVPIVLGSNYDAKVAIPGSFINILDFPSMRAFSDYIKYLDKNNTAYNEHFSWRKKFKLETNSEWLCRLCINLYNHSLPRKVHTNLGAYYGIQNNCHRNKKKLQRLLH